jgi:hypothetical protein
MQAQGTSPVGEPVPAVIVLVETLEDQDDYKTVTLAVSDVIDGDGTTYKWRGLSPEEARQVARALQDAASEAEQGS